MSDLKLPVAHVTAMLVEAQRLRQRALDDGELGASARAELRDAARLLAEDAASYTLPSGLKLSVQAFLDTLDRV